MAGLLAYFIIWISIPEVPVWLPLLEVGVWGTVDIYLWLCANSYAQTFGSHDEPHASSASYQPISEQQQ